MLPGFVGELYRSLRGKGGEQERVYYLLRERAYHLLRKFGSKKISQIFLK
jgi:hypothetical protein